MFISHVAAIVALPKYINYLPKLHIATFSPGTKDIIEMKNHPIPDIIPIHHPKQFHLHITRAA